MEEWRKCLEGRGGNFCVKVWWQETNCREVSFKYTLNNLVFMHVSLENPYSIYSCDSMWFSLSIKQCVRSFLICHLFGLHGLTETAVPVMCNSLFLCTYWTKMSMWNDTIFTWESFAHFWVQIAFIVVWFLIASVLKSGGGEGIRKKFQKAFAM